MPQHFYNVEPETPAPKPPKTLQQSSLNVQLQHNKDDEFYFQIATGTERGRITCTLPQTGRREKVSYVTGYVASQPATTTTAAASSPSSSSTKNTYQQAPTLGGGGGGGGGGGEGAVAAPAAVFTAPAPAAVPAASTSSRSNGWSSFFGSPRAVASAVGGAIAGAAVAGAVAGAGATGAVQLLGQAQFINIAGKVGNRDGKEPELSSGLGWVSGLPALRCRSTGC